MKKVIGFLLIGLLTMVGVHVSAQNRKTDTLIVKTSAVCGQCKTRIEYNMAYERGVKDIVLDLETKKATIAYNPGKTKPEDLRKAISKLGYDADDVAADSVAYQNLPACCKKDAPPH